MRYSSHKIHIFAEAELSHYLASLKVKIRETVHGETPDYLLNVNQEEYIQHIIEQFKIEPLQVHFDKTHVEPHEEQIPAERHPSSSFIVEPGKRYTRQVITYYIPYQGTEELLQLRPNPCILTTQEVTLKEGCICFDIIDFYGDPD